MGLLSVGRVSMKQGGVMKEGGVLGGRGGKKQARGWPGLNEPAVLFSKADANYLESEFQSGPRQDVVVRQRFLVCRSERGGRTRKGVWLVGLMCDRLSEKIVAVEVCG